MNYVFYLLHFYYMRFTAKVKHCAENLQACCRGQALLRPTSQSASQTAPLVGEPLAKRLGFPPCQSLPYKGRWHAAGVTERLDEVELSLRPAGYLAKFHFSLDNTSEIKHRTRCEVGLSCDVGTSQMTRTSQTLRSSNIIRCYIKYFEHRKMFHRSEPA